MGLLSWLSSSAGLAFAAGLGIGLGMGVAGCYVHNKFYDDDDDEDEWTDDDDDSDDDDSEYDDVTGPVKFKGPLKMVMVARQDLKMGKGKMAAQCCHAALAAYKMAKKKAPELLKAYQSQGQMKVVAKVEDEEGLLEVFAKARSLGLVSAIIQDAGRTQIAPGSKTVVAVGPAEAHMVDKVTGSLKLL